MKYKRSLVGTIKLFTALSLLILSLLILSLELTVHGINHALTLEKEKEIYYSKTQDNMKKSVDRIVKRFSFQAEQISLKTKKEVKNRTLEGYTIAQTLYDNGRGSTTEEVLKKEILETIRLLSYRDGAGYYFIISLEGVTLMNKIDTHTENKNSLNLQDMGGKFFIQDMVDLVREKKKGYYSYLWHKPENKEKSLHKTAYVMHFEPYDWIIGTGIYDEDVEKDLKKSLLSSIEYVFDDDMDPIFIIDNKGTELLGQDKGKNFITEGRSEEQFQISNIIQMTTEEGNFIELPSLYHADIENEYLYYARKVENWNWILGTSVCTQELKNKLTAMSLHEKSLQRKEILRILLITLGVGLLLIITLNSINRYFLQDISTFSKFFKQTAMEDIPLDKDIIRYKELADLGLYANKMVRDKKKREEEKHKLRNLESLGFLAAGIAHDFNNALMGILGNVELALENLDDRESTHNYLTRSMEAMDHTKDLTDRLLTFAKGGRPNLQPLLLESVIEELKHSWESKGSLKLENSLTDKDYRVWGDKKQLYLALELLITNGNEAMNGEGTISINAEKTILSKSFPSRLSGNYIRLDVTDRGRGIPEEIREKVFDPYFTTKQTGRGLGLPTVYNILKQHRGHVEAHSDSEKGTTVSLYLPEAPLEDYFTPKEADSDGRE